MNIEKIGKELWIKDTDDKSLFKHIGQLIKACVEEKIAKDLYLIRFSKKLLKVQSNLPLRKGEKITLRVEALSPKVILKKLEDKPHSQKVPSLLEEVKGLIGKYPEVLELLLGPENIKKKDFFKGLGKLLFYLKKEKQSHYIPFIRSINQKLDGIYIQLPFPHFLKDTELFFSFKNRQIDKKGHVIHIRIELSRLGPIHILLEEKGSNLNISFSVKDSETKQLLCEQFPYLHDVIKERCPEKDVIIDCALLPEERLNLPLYLQLHTGKGFDFLI